MSTESNGKVRRHYHGCLTCAGIWPWVSGGLLHYRTRSKEVPSLWSSTPLISSHVCAGDRTVGLWSGKKRCRTQLEPGPVFNISKSKVRTNESMPSKTGPRWENKACPVPKEPLEAGCLPATHRWRCVGANAGGDTGSDRGGDTGGSTGGGLCWCCKPVLLQVPAWHSQLLQMGRKQQNEQRVKDDHRKQNTFGNNEKKYWQKNWMLVDWKPCLDHKPSSCWKSKYHLNTQIKRSTPTSVQKYYKCVIVFGRLSLVTIRRRGRETKVINIKQKHVDSLVVVVCCWPLTQWQHKNMEILLHYV